MTFTITNTHNTTVIISIVAYSDLIGLLTSVSETDYSRHITNTVLSIAQRRLTFSIFVVSKTSGTTTTFLNSLGSSTCMKALVMSERIEDMKYMFRQ